MNKQKSKSIKAVKSALFLCAALGICSMPRLMAADPSYVLGPDDQISIRVLDLDKLQLDNASAPKININGDLDLPIIGRLHASGMTLDQLRDAIALHLNDILNNPNVSVSILQYRSHPVSVLGAVRNPGVFQVPQTKRLLEVLSLAGGLATDAGDTIKISRLTTAGPLPLLNATANPGSAYLVGSVDVRQLVQEADTSLNINILDGDVIAVSQAELVYVIGAVKRAGGFTLGNRQNMSVLQALSLAEGLERTAAPSNARLLREEKPGQDRKEILINLKPILSGAAPDLPLRANDILFVPTSGLKLASVRGIEAAIQLGTGFAVFH